MSHVAWSRLDSIINPLEAVAAAVVVVVVVEATVVAITVRKRLMN